MDWKVAARWTLIIGGAFAAGLIAVWTFTGVWARLGLAAAFLVLALVLYMVDYLSKWQAARKRGRVESGR